MNTNEAILTGPQLFLRFAWPCATHRLAAGKIADKQFRSLELLIDDGAQPDIGLLKDCFPMAVQALREFAGAHGGTDPIKMWSFTTVLQCWRAHRGRTKDCAVIPAVVGSALRGLSLRIQCVDGTLAFNPYGLQPRAGDKILLHRSVAVTLDYLSE